MAAADNGQTVAVQLLLQTPEIDINLQNHAGEDLETFLIKNTPGRRLLNHDLLKLNF